MHTNILALVVTGLLVAGCSDQDDWFSSVKVEQPGRRSSGEPRLTRLEFPSSDNPGLLISDAVCTIIGDSVAECWVPHFMAGKRLVARFSIEGEMMLADSTRVESAVTAIDYSKPVSLTVYGHGQRSVYIVLVHAFTGLPVLWIETEGRTEVTSKEEYARASFRLVEDVVTRSPGDSIELTGQIRGRGNSTWSMPKKPYRLKLDSKTSLLGMPADKSWVLLANYADKTMLRNATALRLAVMDGIGYAPRSHFVEVVLNGSYDGTYQLCEKVELSRHRVDAGGDGFLLEVDAKAVGEADARYFSVAHVDNIVNIKEPHVEYGDADFDYARRFMTEADSVLFSDDFTDPEKGWRKYMDMDSFVDWYLINEIARNNDARMFSSCFMNFSRGGKLHMGPVWDFDIAFGNVDYRGNYEPEGFWIKHQAWFDRLFMDSIFRARVKERFAYFYSRFDDILDGINADAHYLRYSVEENENRWGTLYRATWPNYNVWGCYDNEVQYMKSWLTRRMNWLREEYGKM